jgi:hypothetical protein
VLTLAVTSVLGVVTFQLTKTTEAYKVEVERFETNTKKYAVVTDLLQKCTSEQPDNRNYFLFLRQNQSDKDGFDLMTVTPTIASDKGFQSQFRLALNRCMAWAVKTVGAPQAEPIAAMSPKPISGQGSNTSAQLAGSEPAENWVYLGHYDGHWSQYYLTFPTDFDPRTLTKDHPTPPNSIEYPVRAETGSLYLRYGSFGVNGEFPPVKRALAPGTKLEIKRTWPWLGDDDWWAVVELK